jgi:bifunctional non-homologous end joining protein LigD
MIKLTHLDKPYWKKEKIVKGDLIEYYRKIAPFILPYLKNRPLVMHRFPNGVGGVHFYQKDVATELPDFVKTAKIKHVDRTIRYILVQNLNTLLYVANLGSIELHVFNAPIDHLEKPDYLVLDLDPTGVSFSTVIEVARAIHDMLDELDLPHYCKTSGGSGLHIYLPLNGKYPFPEVKSFARLLARAIHARLPTLTSLERNPQKRQRKVYIDCLQNEHMQTVACTYSVRARPHAPVSTPLLWKEVKSGLEPTDFTIHNVPKRLSQKHDLFKAVLSRGILIAKYLKKLEKFL